MAARNWVTDLHIADGFLCLQHARLLGGEAVGHECGGTEVARAEEHSFDEHCVVVRMLQRDCQQRQEDQRFENLEILLFVHL